MELHLHGSQNQLHVAQNVLVTDKLLNRL